MVQEAKKGRDFTKEGLVKVVGRKKEKIVFHHIQPQFMEIQLAFEKAGSVTVSKSHRSLSGTHFLLGAICVSFHLRLSSSLQVFL